MTAENRPDNIVAAELKANLRQALLDVCAVCTHAAVLGFKARYTTGPDKNGDEDIVSLTISKDF